MVRRRPVLAAALTILLAEAVFAPPAAGGDDPHVIVAGDSLQEAVDAARPGDTIVVPPGTYEGGVVLDKSGITIRGSRAAVIDASGHSMGIRVGTGRIAPGLDGWPVCPPTALHDITIEGLTVRDAEFTGVFLSGVDGFRLSGGRYTDNDEYGPFPICSRNGLIEHNEVSGTEDAGIYVGDSTDVAIVGNRVTRSAIGIEAENTARTVIRTNTLTDNTVGILVSLLPGLPLPLNEDTLIEGNTIHHNNFPNPVPPDGGDEVGLLPTGSGVINIGGDRMVMLRNSVVGNDTVGVAVLSTPFAAEDPRLEPAPDGNEVRSNTTLRNGASPDPLRPIGQGADILYDGTGTGTCFGPNVFATDSPPGITGLFPC
ncbi:parallel beta-helix domain-containing protein [Streptomyces sp. NPDC051940]|uniref:parallel beta-helix domain-containing protein n=1 Tax=Streptomyces sp. NPDC051940 TaxID=3155675 RepID=UPI003428C2A3